MSPGMPVFGSALPQTMIRPKSCPRLVSITRWQSAPAVKPGPSAITSGASSLLVPRLRFARIASTTTSGARPSIRPQSVMRRTAMVCVFQAASIPFQSRAATARTPSTTTIPDSSTVQNDTCRRTHSGSSRSNMQICRMLAMYRRQAMALAISPAPFTRMNGDTGTTVPVFIARSLRLADQALRLALDTGQAADRAHFHLGCHRDAVLDGFYQKVAGLLKLGFGQKLARRLDPDSQMSAAAQRRRHELVFLRELVHFMQHVLDLPRKNVDPGEMK